MGNPWIGKRTSLPPLVEITEIVKELHTLQKVAVRLHPRRGESVLEASKMGGSVLWGAETPLPMCEAHSIPRIPILQLRKDDVPQLPFREGEDLFQIWWCPKDHEGTYAPDPAVFWLSLKDFANIPLRDEFPIPEVEDHENESIPFPCLLNPEPVTDYPHAFDLADYYPEIWEKITKSDQLRELALQHPEFNVKSAVDLYQYLLGASSGTKLGGYPNWSQSPEYLLCDHGHQMEFLAQIDSAEFDGGTWGRWLTIEEKEVWEADYRTRNKVQRAAGLMLGDMGALFFSFVIYVPIAP